jgi:diadenosine tetraphosphate (Ap4A) HIT family hydrolase
MKIYEDKEFFIESEKSDIPWLKIFTQQEYKELSDLPDALRLKLFKLYDIVELEMKNYFSPDKINMASFGNMLPRVHLHVMARFENDSHFPNPMWGEIQRESTLELPSFGVFYERLQKRLEGFTS